MTTIENTAQIETAEINYSEMSSADLIVHFGNTSKAIRNLAALGFTRGAIAKMLNKRYQHVRNVLITPVKKA